MNEQATSVRDVSLSALRPEVPDNVIAIGASLGGVQAICEIVEALPPGFPTPILIVIHTSPLGVGVMDKVLSRKTSLSVSYGDEGEKIEFGHIYIAPPNHHLTVSQDKRLHLDTGPREHHTRPAIDRLFKSVALYYGARTIGVILTGGDHDGGDGLRSVVRAGGLAIVQDPDDALDPDMPTNALRSATAQFIIPLIEIAPLIVRLSDRMRAVSANERVGTKR